MRYEGLTVPLWAGCVLDGIRRGGAQSWPLGQQHCAAASPQSVGLPRIKEGEECDVASAVALD